MAYHCKTHVKYIAKPYIDEKIQRHAMLFEENQWLAVVVFCRKMWLNGQKNIRYCKNCRNIENRSIQYMLDLQYSVYNDKLIRSLKVCHENSKL